MIIINMKLRSISFSPLGMPEAEIEQEAEAFLGDWITIGQKIREFG